MRLKARPWKIGSASITALPASTAAAVSIIGRKRTTPASSTASASGMPSRNFSSMKSTRMMLLRTMIPAPAVNPISRASAPRSKRTNSPRGTWPRAPRRELYATEPHYSARPRSLIRGVVGQLLEEQFPASRGARHVAGEQPRLLLEQRDEVLHGHADAGDVLRVRADHAEHFGDGQDAGRDPTKARLATCEQAREDRDAEACGDGAGDGPRAVPAKHDLPGRRVGLEPLPAGGYSRGSARSPPRRAPRASRE